MKKLILLLTLAFVMCGCGAIGYLEPDRGIQLINDEEFNQKYVTTYIIDSCEYIHLAGISCLQHKGNCKYCAERHKKEQKELIIRLKEE